MKTEIGISPANTAEIAQSLNTLLADEHVLYIKTRRAHWNVEGQDFLTTHRFVEEQYKQLAKLINHGAFLHLEAIQQEARNGCLLMKEIKPILTLLKYP